MKKYFLLMVTAMLVMMAGTVMTSCSKDGENDIADFSNGQYGFLSDSGENGEKSTPSAPPLVVSELQIQSENGDIDSCWLYPAYCGKTDPVTNIGPDNNAYEVYPMVFTAVIRESSLFNALQFDIWSKENINIEDLNVGDTFDSSTMDGNGIHLKVWQESAVDAIIPRQNMPGTLGGKIEVIDKKTVESGYSFITLSLQDIKFSSYDTEQNQCYYTLNGKIEFEICDNGVYPNPTNGFNGNFDMETALIPADELISFMMDALYRNESQGRSTLFSEGSEEQECLIINSVEDFRKVYKGDKDISPIIHHVNFDYCSLVIGRTYGEHGGVSLGGFDLTDNGDAYQLDVTLNNNVNPDLTYTQAFIDLYFWKIYPKMEKKPVVFNRIRQDVNIDLLDAYAPIRKRWILTDYSDADGTLHQVSQNWGDERYSIEFKEDGTVEGRINLNDYNCYYTVPYFCTYDGKRDGYNGDLHYGLINLWNWKVTKVNDDDPLSNEFMRIFNATEFKLWSSDFLTIKISDKEYFAFFRENLKESYGY